MTDTKRILVAIPVYNEEKHVLRVLERVLEYARNILVIDDGSTDHTPCLLPERPVEVIRHARNRGYGRSLQDAFRWALVDGFEWVITMDCDEQHEPEEIPVFLRAIEEGGADVISGSRYLAPMQGNDSPPENRRSINRAVTEEINRRLGLSITDAFCGFKAYRVKALDRMRFDENGYAFPLQFWTQAVAAGVRIREVPVRLIYNDPKRTFGGPLDHDQTRLDHYRCALKKEIERCHARLPASAMLDWDCVCGPARSSGRRS